MKYEIPAEAEDRLPAPDTRSGRLSRWFLQRVFSGRACPPLQGPGFIAESAAGKAAR